jgi:hypothetical protein
MIFYHHHHEWARQSRNQNRNGHFTTKVAKSTKLGNSNRSISESFVSFVRFVVNQMSFARWFYFLTFMSTAKTRASGNGL